MLIYPAIDLLGGACVRLLRGSYDEVTEFSRDPLAVARRFVGAGAPALHVVDLDGARAGRPVSAELILRIRGEVGVPLQVGGGLRRDEDVALYLEAGIERAILGTRALEEPGWIGRMLERHGPERVAAAVDVRGESPLTHGWTVEADPDLGALLAALRALGVTTAVYTDSTRDGALAGPDLAGTRTVVEGGFRVIAAGGISSAEDILRLREIGVAGAVIGSALYRGTLTVDEAVEASRSPAAMRPAPPKGPGTSAGGARSTEPRAAVTRDGGPC